jgi:hypothetical protein
MTFCTQAEIDSFAFGGDSGGACVNSMGVRERASCELTFASEKILAK